MALQSLDGRASGYRPSTFAISRPMHQISAKWIF